LGKDICQIFCNTQAIQRYKDTFSMEMHKVEEKKNIGLTRLVVSYTISLRYSRVQDKVHQKQNGKQGKVGKSPQNPALVGVRTKRGETAIESNRTTKSQTASRHLNL
jgi:hypothetical protein